jgi:hypothetical protein
MPKLGYVDLPFGQPTFPDPGITRIAVDNAGNPIASVGGAAFASIGGGGGSGITVTPNTGLSGTGTAGSPLAGVAASGSVPGTMTPTQFTKLLGTIPLSRGTDLTDSSPTINPFTDHCSLYVLQNGVLTANRILTLATAGGFGPLTVTIVVLDTSGFTYAIKDIGGTTPFTHPASSVPIAYTLYNSTGTGWTANISQFCGAT